MNKKIITIAEIVFALVFVVLLSVFMATINSKGTTANNQLVDTLEMTDGTSLSKYSTGEKVKGTDVANVVNNYKTIGGNLKLEVVVVTKQNENGTAYGYNRGQSTTHTSTYSADSTKDNYINPTANFTPKVATNNNKVEDRLIFVQEGCSVDADTIATYDYAEDGNKL